MCDSTVLDLTTTSVVAFIDDGEDILHASSIDRKSRDLIRRQKEIAFYADASIWLSDLITLHRQDEQ